MKLWPKPCPACEKEVRIEPSAPVGHFPCPHCGCLLWFVYWDHGYRLFKHEDTSPRKRELIEDASLAPDSLLTVEIAMEVEEELGLQIPHGETEKIKTMDDLIDFILRNVPD